jgi:hypothetical protein
MTVEEQRAGHQKALNDRQRAYLLAIFETDQELEQQIDAPEPSFSLVQETM